MTSVAVDSSLASAVGWVCFQEESGGIRAVLTDLSVSQDVRKETLNVTCGDPGIALPRSAIAAAAVFTGGYLPESLDIWYQPKGNEIMESLNLACIYNLTLLPV